MATLIDFNHMSPLQKKIADVVTDVTGGGGAVLLSIAPSLQTIEVGIRLLAAFGGLVLLWYSIKLKRVLLKKAQEEKEVKDGDNI
jgi:hypothetical protein